MAFEVKVFFGIFWTFPVSSTRAVDYNWTTPLKTTLGTIKERCSGVATGNTFPLKIVTLRTINLSQCLPCLFILMHSSKGTFRISLQSWSMNCSSWLQRNVGKKLQAAFPFHSTHSFVPGFGLSPAQTPGRSVARLMVLAGCPAFVCTNSHNTIIPYLLSI